MKRFVCEKCSTEKVKGSDFTGTRCPKCGRKMDLKSYTTQKPGTENSEIDEEKKWARSSHSWPKKAREEARKDAKRSNRDTHDEDQSTEDQSDREGWWGEGRWWARWGALPLGLFLLQYAVTVRAGIISTGVIFPEGAPQKSIFQEWMLLYVLSSAPICAAYVWMLGKELTLEKPGNLFLTLFTFVCAAIAGVTVVAGLADHPPLVIIANLEFATSTISFFSLTLLRLGSVTAAGDDLTVDKWGGSSERSSSGRKRKFRGYVYVATNPNIKGLVKIGYTERTVEKRMKELSSSTGVPGRYKAKYKFKAVRPKQLERKVHRRLSSRRVERGGEFFKVSPKKAARVIKKVAA
jgi:hypothetical protein